VSEIQTAIDEDEDELEDQETEEDDDLEDEEEDSTEKEEELEDEEVEQQPESDGEPFGVWDNTVATKRIKILLYGLSGMGKTTMAATFPKPIFLDLEGGMLSVRKYSPYRYPADHNKDIRRYEEVVDFYEMVRTRKNPPFETIVIDSLNELQLLVAQYVVKKYSKVKRQYDDQLTLADYGKANRDFSKVVRLFLKLPFHVVFTAASTQKQFGDDTDVMISPKFVGAQVGPDIQRMMDMIGYCFSRPTPNGSGEHYVSFRMTPKYLAKDRLGIAKQDIPNSFEALMSNTKGEI
jgi:hypothetical protein